MTITVTARLRIVVECEHGFTRGEQTDDTETHITLRKRIVQEHARGCGKKPVCGILELLEQQGGATGDPFWDDEQPAALAEALADKAKENRKQKR